MDKNDNNDNNERLIRRYKERIHAFVKHYNELIKQEQEGRGISYEKLKIILPMCLKEILDIETELNNKGIEIKSKWNGKKLKGKYRELYISYMMHNIDKYGSTIFINRGKIRGTVIEENDKSIKYSDDGNVNTNPIPLTDAKVAAEAYGEGYKPLEDLLYNCFKNGIQTLACCAGHEQLQDSLAYITFRRGQHITSIANKLLTDPQIKTMCERILFSNHEEVDSTITFYTNLESRESLFNYLNSEVSEIIQNNTAGKDDVSCDSADRLCTYVEEKQNPIFVMYFPQIQEFYVMGSAKPIKFTLEELNKQPDAIFENIDTIVKYGNNQTVIGQIKTLCAEVKLGLMAIQSAGDRFTEQLRSFMRGNTVQQEQNSTDKEI